MIEIFHADTRLATALLCDAHFDTLIVDPPYAPKVHDRATSNETAGAGPHARDLGFSSLDATLLESIARITASAKRWSAVFSDIESSHLWLEAIETTDADYIRTVPWVRWSQPQLSGDRPPSECELVTLAHSKGRKSWNGPGSLTAFNALSLRGANKYSCEKPLDLMLSLVAWFSDAGETGASRYAKAEEDTKRIERVLKCS